jgi:hypothetical protein
MKLMFGVLLEARGAFESGLVERLVELAARVVDDAQFRSWPPLRSPKPQLRRSSWKVV